LDLNKTKKPTLKKEWENCYEKEKVTEFKKSSKTNIMNIFLKKFIIIKFLSLRI